MSARVATKVAAEDVFKQAYADVLTVYPTCRAVIIGAVVSEGGDQTSVHVAVALPSTVRERLGEAALVALNVAVESAIAESFGLGPSGEVPS